MVNDDNHPIYEKTAEEYTEKGNNNYHKSEFEKAIEAYKKDIKIDPDSDGAHHNIGLAYDNLGKFEKAIEAYKKAIMLLKLLFTNCNLSHLAKISSPSCNSENLSMELVSSKKTLPPVF
jgi:tetratricopeptide (TPR) repeat protein